MILLFSVHKRVCGGIPWCSSKYSQTKADVWRGLFKTQGESSKGELIYAISEDDDRNTYYLYFIDMFMAYLRMLSLVQMYHVMIR
jgi:hypothetical protein